MLEGRPAELGAVLEPRVTVVAAAFDDCSWGAGVEAQDGLAAVAGECGASLGGGNGGHVAGRCYSAASGVGNVQ